MFFVVISWYSEGVNKLSQAQTEQAGSLYQSNCNLLEYCFQFLGQTTV